MPRIPVLHAEGRPGILQLPRPTGAGFVQGFGELGKLGEKLQDQQDKLDLAQLAGEYEGGLAEIRLGLKQDPDFKSHPTKFTQRVTQLQGELAKRATSATVRQALQAHIARTLPKETVEVQTEALTLWTQHQLAGLDVIEESLSKDAAEAATPEARDDKIMLYEGLLLGAEQQRILSPVQRQQKRRSFNEKVLERNMEFLARTNPTELYVRERDGAFAGLDPVKRERIVGIAVRLQEKAERETERIFKDERDVRVRELVTLARDGQLTQRQLDEDARIWRMGREDYDRIRDHMEKGPTLASNPDTLKHMTLEVRTRPREALTGELASLYRNNNLNRDDYQQLDNELKTLLKSGSERSDIRFRHSQAEQLIRTAYGADNPFFRRLQGAEIDTAIALAYRDLTAESSAFGGQSDPIEAAQRIIPKYLPHIPGAVESRIKVELGQLPYKTIQELGPKEQARARGLTEEQWRAYAKKLKEIEDLRLALQAYRLSRQQGQGQPR